MNVLSEMPLLFAACKCCCFDVPLLEPKSAWSHKSYQNRIRNAREIAVKPEEKSLRFHVLAQLNWFNW